jgi:hypothetical protein
MWIGLSQHPGGTYRRTTNPAICLPYPRSYGGKSRHLAINLRGRRGVAVLFSIPVAKGAILAVNPDSLENTLRTHIAMLPLFYR